MSVVGRLRRAEALEQALDELVSLLQADELDIDELDQAVRHADAVLIGPAKRETRNAEPVTAPDSEKACRNTANNIRTDPTAATEPSQDSQNYDPRFLDHESSPPKGYQQCPRCELDKPFGEFAASSLTSNGRDIWCRDCKSVLNGQPPAAEGTSDEATARTTASPQKVCDVHGCSNTHLAKGYCAGHYSRYRKHGDPQADIPLGETTPGVPLGQQSQKERAEDAPIPDEKACGECGETKPLDDFPANKNTRDGHQGRCFACFRASAAKARAAQAAKRARANGSEPAGPRRSPKPADAGSTPARPASAEPSTYENGSSAEDHIEAHVDSMIGAVSGPHRTFTLVDRRGNDVAVEAHPDPDDPAVWAAMLGRVHAAIHDEPVVVTHQPAGGGNGRHPVQKHQAGIR